MRPSLIMPSSCSPTCNTRQLIEPKDYITHVVYISITIPTGFCVKVIHPLRKY